MSPYYKSNKHKKQTPIITWEVCTHPFKKYIPPSAETLIIGTFPTYHKYYSATFHFYYGSEMNPFWENLGSVYNVRFKHNLGEKAVIERQMFLQKNKLGITDMLYQCYRRGQSSKDEDLYLISFNNIFEMLREHSNISKLVLTSRTKVYGALGLLETYFLQHGLELEQAKKRSDNIIETAFEFEGRSIIVYVPYSTSARNEYGTPEILFDMYKAALGKNN